ncbi:MAG: SMI1/KNR4 family protein [Gammaproteobacteria bacterium]|nr:SMI1/KNR4 family protein [Gammaproteobacteria bacterium]
MEDIIESLRECNLEVAFPLTLPDEDDLIEIEEQLLLPLPEDYKTFLLTVSDVICGHLEPATVTDPQSHTYLPEMAATAWDNGVSRELIPICEVDGDYYCIDQDGLVVLWSGDDVTEDEWSSIWVWAKEIWLEG